MNIEITSVAHKEQRAVDVEVAVHRAPAPWWRLDGVPNVRIAACTRADVRLQVPMTLGLFLLVVGQNLFDPEHAEYAGVGAT